MNNNDSCNQLSSGVDVMNNNDSRKQLSSGIDVMNNNDSCTQLSSVESTLMNNNDSCTHPRGPNARHSDCRMRLPSAGRPNVSIPRLSWGC